MSDTPPRFAWDWAGAWTIVFLANLPIPLAFGYLLVAPDGLLGLWGALAVLFWIGFALCLFRFRVGRSLVWGGAAIAASQLVPIVQVFCGSFGLGMWEKLGGQPLLQDEDYHGPWPGWQGDRNVGAFMAVFFTAHPMLVLAVLIGATIRWWKGDRPIWFAPRTDPDAEPAAG